MTDDDNPARGRQRLADELAMWMVRSGVTSRREMSRYSTISQRILDDLFAAERPSYNPRTLALLDVLLGWESGSARAILAGGEPTPTNLTDEEREQILAANRTPVEPEPSQRAETG